MRFFIAAFLAAHGIAHVMGFAVPWKFVTSPELPYRTTIFTGLWDVGDAGIRVVGAFWLVGAALFLAAAATWAFDWSSAIVLTVTAVGVSTLLCGIDWPQTNIGLTINGAIAVALVLTTHVRPFVHS